MLLLSCISLRRHVLLFRSPSLYYWQAIMSHVPETADEQTQLLDPRVAELSGQERGNRRGEDATSITSSHLSKEEQALSATAIGERLPYNDYTTIDWLHDLVSTNPWQITFLLILILSLDQGLIPTSSNYITERHQGSFSRCLGFLSRMVCSFFDRHFHCYCCFPC